MTKPVITTEIRDGFEHRFAEMVVKQTGSAAEKVQRLIDLYETQHPDADTPVREVLANLKTLKWAVGRR